MSGVPQYNRPHNGADAKDVMQPVVGDGSNIFDPEENRNDVFSETAKTRNTITHVPYRGNEQHGVEFNTPAQDYTPYWSEQAAEDKYMSPEVTPRDIVPMKPVPVQVVNNPDLIHPGRITMTSQNVMPAGVSGFDAVALNMQMIVSPQQFRKNLKLKAGLNNSGAFLNLYGVSAAGASFGAYLSLVSNPQASDLFFVTGGLASVAQQTPYLDLDNYWGPVYAYVTNVGSTPPNALPVTFTAISTFDTYEGAPLI